MYRRNNVPSWIANPFHMSFLGTVLYPKPIGSGTLLLRNLLFLVMWSLMSALHLLHMLLYFLYLRLHLQPCHLLAVPAFYFGCSSGSSFISSSEAFEFRGDSSDSSADEDPLGYSEGSLMALPNGEGFRFLFCALFVYFWWSS